MRISDWSSDVCSSDLTREELQGAMAAGAARNAVDCALWDLQAKLSGRSVTERLGRPAIAPTPTAITVSLDRPGAMAEAAAALADAPLVKIKGDRPAIGKASWRERVGQYG